MGGNCTENHIFTGGSNALSARRAAGLIPRSRPGLSRLDGHRPNVPSGPFEPPVQLVVEVSVRAQGKWKVIIFGGADIAAFLFGFVRIGEEPEIIEPIAELYDRRARVRRGLYRAKVGRKAHGLQLGQQPDGLRDLFAEHLRHLLARRVTILDYVVQQGGADELSGVNLKLVYERDGHSERMDYVRRAFVSHLPQVRRLGDLEGAPDRDELLAADVRAESFDQVFVVSFVNHRVS